MVQNLQEKFIWKEDRIKKITEALSFKSESDKNIILFLLSILQYKGANKNGINICVDDYENIFVCGAHPHHYIFIQFFYQLKEWDNLSLPCFISNLSVLFNLNMSSRRNIEDFILNEKTKIHTLKNIIFGSKYAAINIKNIFDNFIELLEIPRFEVSNPVLIIQIHCDLSIIMI